MSGRNKGKNISESSTLRKEGRSYYGMAWHIQKEPGESLEAVCGYTMLDLSTSDRDMSPEYLVELVEQRKVEHGGYYYCAACYEAFTGRTKPPRHWQD